jgi:small-conductance mechanosensitive channel
MSASEQALSAGWSRILDEVHSRLDQAITSANVRLESHVQPAAPRDRLQSIAQWNDRLQRLHAHLNAVEQIVHSVDEALEREETLLRQTHLACAALRQRLADGRAIG